MTTIWQNARLKRVAVLLLFIGLLVAFRHLALLLILFVLLERMLRTGAELLARRWRVPVPVSVIGLVVVTLGLLGVAITIGVAKLLPALPGLGQDLVAQFEHVRGWLHQMHIAGGGDDSATEGILDKVHQYSGNIMRFAGSAGKKVAYVLIGLILAIVYAIEHKELEAWHARLPPTSLPRVLLHYVDHVCDAITITAKLQVVVAVVNTLITLPVLIVLGLPSIPALTAFLFATSLIPVVGAFISGVVLGVLAYLHKGPGGVAVFVATTFVLHKIESYYLNPRLTAKHVRLPGFALLVSMILFEHVFGLKGLFMSFPALYVAARIREDWRSGGDGLPPDSALQFVAPSPDGPEPGSG
jgi:predicted PurR-regulated permease PerM